MVYALSRFGKEYLSRWRMSHSFGTKARERFDGTTRGKRYWEERWLSAAGLSRAEVARMIEDRRQHPLYRFIFPEYEEATKRRMLSTEATRSVSADAVVDALFALMPGLHTRGTVP